MNTDLHGEVINGAGQRFAPGSPLEALEQFYSAFNGCDLSAMARNWAPRADVAMSNPLGGIRRGWEQIRTVYERIFNGPARVYVEFHDFHILAGTDLFCAIGRERGWFRTNTEEVPLAIRTTRIYQHGEGAWRQVHHHGSMDDPELLARYQRAVSGAGRQGT